MRRLVRNAIIDVLDRRLTISRTGGQIGNNDSADDVRDVDLTKVHYLSGPFEG